MMYLILRSYLMLIAVDVALRRAGLKNAYKIVSESTTRQIAGDRRVPYEHICKSVDLACVFYPKTVFCLQRSVAGVAVLRASGWPAEFVTGCSISTFENHAWAELNGAVVNDKPYMHEMYQVLDRL
ncbi:lasso peptide biosynthesis B2 protein [Acidicapsa ligni]|uniref:lasso peptide biosynthesis B2 protein n=1 Tax=Acidicapsa ligni TaxID=542300 RepID=UPI0021DF767E|nr:lasso peptide biosynthesis B2 protein [Acidicapsa ligni]